MTSHLNQPLVCIQLARNLIQCFSSSSLWTQKQVCAADQNGQKQGSHYPQFKFLSDAIPWQHSHLTQYNPKIVEEANVQTPVTIPCPWDKTNSEGWNIDMQVPLRVWVSFLLDAISNYQLLFREWESGKQTDTDSLSLSHKRTTAFILLRGSKTLRTPQLSGSHTSQTYDSFHHKLKII